MLFVLLSDLQMTNEQPVARLDDVVEVQARKLDYVLRFAKENNAVVLQAGDFCDTSRSWFLLSKLLSIFEEYKGLEIYVVFGQHDTYMYNESTRDATVLGTLIGSGVITGILEPHKSIKFPYDRVRVFGCSYGQLPLNINRTYEGSKHKQYKQFTNILVIHKSIGPSKTWKGMIDYEYAPSFLREYKNYDLILCGDIHRKFLYRVGERTIVNTGCLLRDTAERYNFKHKPGFYVFNSYTKKLHWKEIPHEQAKKVLSRTHIDTQKGIKDAVVEPIGELSVGAAVSFMDNLVLYDRKEGIKEPVKRIIAETMDEEIQWKKRKKLLIS